MKKVILLGFLLISSSFLSSCSPIVQGAAAVTTVATMANDRRSMGEILDDKALYMDLRKSCQQGSNAWMMLISISMYLINLFL